MNSFLPASAVSFQINRIGVARNRNRPPTSYSNNDYLHCHHHHCHCPPTPPRAYVKKCGCLSDYRLPPPSPSPLPSHRFARSGSSHVQLIYKGRYGRPPIRQEIPINRRSQTIATSVSTSTSLSTSSPSNTGLSSMYMSNNLYRTINSTTRRPFTKLDDDEETEKFGSESFILKKKDSKESVEKNETEIVKSEEEEEEEPGNLFASPSMMFTEKSEKQVSGPVKSNPCEEPQLDEPDDHHANKTSIEPQKSRPSPKIRSNVKLMPILVSNYDTSSDIRKDFMRKQQELRRSHYANPRQTTTCSVQQSGSIKSKDVTEHFRVRSTITTSTNNETASKNLLKPKPTIFPFGGNGSTTTNAPNGGSTKVQQLGSSSTTTSKPIILLNFDKYKVTESLSSSNKNQKPEKVVINVPITPRKVHTFNEHETPSHKVSACTFVLNECKPDTNEPNHASGHQKTVSEEKLSGSDVLIFQRPLMRTGSTVNTNSGSTKPLIRRQPKEFLTASITSTKPHEAKKTMRTSSKESYRDEVILFESTKSQVQTSMTASTSSKLLPSYDEALKRVNNDGIKTNTISKVTSDQPSSSIQAEPSQSQTTTINITSNSNQIKADSPATLNIQKNRPVLPVIHMQSTFKSLISVPYDTTSKSSNNSKAYYKPTSLSNELEQNANKDGNSKKSSISGGSNTSPDCSDQSSESIPENNINTNAYPLNTQRASVERLHNGIPVVNSNRKLSASKSDSSQNKSKVKNVSADSIDTTKNNHSSANAPPPVNPRQNIPINIAQNTTLNNNSSDLISNATTTSNCPKSNNNNNSGHTKNSVDMVNQSPAITLPLHRAPSPSVLNTNTKLKSWSNYYISTNMNSNENNPNNQAGFSDGSENGDEARREKDATRIPIIWNCHRNSSARQVSSVTREILSNEANNVANAVNSKVPANKASDFYSNSMLFSEGKVDQDNNFESQYQNGGIISSSSTSNPAHPSNVRKNSENLVVNYDKNFKVLSPGKLVDAVAAAAASNSIEDGLGLAIMNPNNKNFLMAKTIKSRSNSASGLNANGRTDQPMYSFNDNLSRNGIINFDKQKASHINMAFIEDDDLMALENARNEYGRPKEVDEKNLHHYKPSSNMNSDLKHIRKKMKNNDQDSNSNISFQSSSSISSPSSMFKSSKNRSKSTTNIRNQNLIELAKNENFKIKKNARRNEMSSHHHHHQDSNGSPKKSSLNAITDYSNTNTITTSNVNSTSKSSNLRRNNLFYNERPPGRLNYYDSDTNTISDLINGPSSLKVEPIRKKSTLNNLSQSPSLSDLNGSNFESNFAGVDGHRTSTPNLSKKKRSASYSSSDMHLVKNQLKNLEKMYHEILRIVDTDKNNSNMGGSFRSNSSLLSLLGGKKDGKRSQSRGDQKAIQKSGSNSQEMHQLKRRFSRMESHLTALAKTVAQISLELKSIKSLEDIIGDLRRDVQEMRNYNANGIYFSNKDVDLHKSISEPNVHQAALDALKNEPSSHKNSHSRKLEFQREKERIRSCAPSYTNPRKLKKLTKFFGQEPPMLRLFLQKLDYEIYAKNFENEQITITELPYLSEERLKALGIPLGPRIRILQEAQQSIRHENFNVYIL